MIFRALLMDGCGFGPHKHHALAHEFAGGEGEAGAEGDVPVFPVVDAVADTQLAGDALTAQLAVVLEGLLEKEVIVAYVDEPADRLHVGFLLLGGMTHELYGRVVVDGALYIGGLVVGVELRGIVGKPGAHGVARGEHIGMTLCIDGAAATSHGEAADGTVLLVTDDVVALLDGRQELLIEEVLVGPAVHVEVAVPGGAGLRTAGIGHDDDEGTYLSGTDELVHHDLKLSLLGPGGIGVGEAMEEVEDGILGIGRGIVTLRQIDIEKDFGAEHLTVDAVFDNLRPRCRYTEHQGQNQE